VTSLKGLTWATVIVRWTLEPAPNGEALIPV